VEVAIDFDDGPADLSKQVSAGMMPGLGPLAYELGLREQYFLP